MEKHLIVGLGNPGTQYDNTPHNLGFAVVDILAKHTNTTFEHEPKFSAAVAQIGTALLAKPTTYMNKSGESVAAIARYYKIPAPSITVIHDDFDIPVGEYKVQKGVGPKNHGGINSIVASLATEDFVRYRIGIGKRGITNLEAYVLKPIAAQDTATLARIVETIAQELQPNAA